MEQPKYPLGDEVEVRFIGKIVRIESLFSGGVEYKIDNYKGSSAYVKESFLYPLPTEESK